MSSPPPVPDFLEELGADVADAGSRLYGERTQTARRAFTRAVFAAVEGVTNRLKLQVIEENEWGPSRQNLSVAEIAMLREEAYSLNDKGEARVQPRFVRTDDNVIFALRMYMADYGLKATIDRGDEGWRSFKSALRVRHRVTHPRRVSDLEISDQELQIVKMAYEWFIYTVANHMAKVNKHLESKAAQIAEP